jgi:von Willebrand factor type A domain
MRTRLRIPSIFNLAMVDVLCCALGCVILLWLLNLREAKQRTIAAEHATEDLSRTRMTLATTEQQRRAAEDAEARLNQSLRQSASDLEAAGRRIQLQGAERDRLSKQITAADSRLSNAEKALRASQDSQGRLAEQLGAKTAQSESLASQLAAVTRREAGTTALLEQKDAELRSRTQRVSDLTARLGEAESRSAADKARASLLADAADQGRRDRDRLERLDARVGALTLKLEAKDRSLAGAEGTIRALRTDGTKLQQRLASENAAAEYRFAGMQMTGRRVVFLVDMSGSMELVDEHTRAPEKWRGVQEAVTRIMRSLGELEKFQLIVFSNQVSFPLGHDGYLIDYDPARSTSAVAAALSAIRPKGGTDMHAGMESAFRLRDQGLDTIYLFSDGLPNMGAGLDPVTAPSMKENEREIACSNYIRQILRTVWNRQVDGRVPVRINTVGFFYESPDVGAFLWALARENDGSFAGMSKP